MTGTRRIGHSAADNASAGNSRLALALIEGWHYVTLIVIEAATNSDAYTVCLWRTEIARCAYIQDGSDTQRTPGRLVWGFFPWCLPLLILVFQLERPPASCRGLLQLH